MIFLFGFSNKQRYPSLLGSYYSVHIDDDRIDRKIENVTASPYLYLCCAGHYQGKGHVIWDYKRCQN